MNSKFMEVQILQKVCISTHNCMFRAQGSIAIEVLINPLKGIQRGYCSYTIFKLVYSCRKAVPALNQVFVQIEMLQYCTSTNTVPREAQMLQNDIGCTSAHTWRKYCISVHTGRCPGR